MSTVVSSARGLLADRRALIGWAIALAVGLGAALWEAKQAGVAGVAAIPEVARAALATVAVFGVCGYAIARLLVPAALAPYRLLFVLPAGAVASGMTLTLLGFAAVPFHIALALVLAGGALSAIASRRRPAPDRGGVSRGAGLQLIALGGIVALIVAVALLPSFRSGVATVTGYGSDAHLVAGTSTLLQHAYPSSTQPDYPIDKVQVPWRSKYPIYYALAAVSSVAGLEPWQVLMTVAAIMLAAAGLGFFLLARFTFGAPAGIAALAMVAAVLDRMVFHLALHPYYNQLFGMLTLPFALVLADSWVRTRETRTLWLLGLMLAGGVFAYPLMLPFPLLALAGLYVVDRRRRQKAGEPVDSLDPRRLWRGPKSLIWIVPLLALLAVPLRGVAEKLAEGVAILGDPTNSLKSWRGDVTFYPGPEFFLGTSGIVFSAALAAAVVIGAFWTLWKQPRRVGVPYAVLLALAYAAAFYFRAVEDGEYFYFKVLSFAGPIFVTVAICGLGAVMLRYKRLLAARIVAAALLAVLLVSSFASARDEVTGAFDQLTGPTRELRGWARDLPPRASIRLDTPSSEQMWQAYMLSSHPLGSYFPDLTHPHVPYSTGGDYALRKTLELPPLDAARFPDHRVRPPVRTNSALHLWKLTPRRDRPDTTSRAQVQIATQVSLGG